MPNILTNLQAAIKLLETEWFPHDSNLRQTVLSALHQKIELLSGKRCASMSAAQRSERKIVTVVFADISGFTRLSEQMGPEPVTELINSCFTHLAPIIERYGGYIDKFIGDEIMAIFGAPITHEKDAECALQAALEMNTALQDFNTQYGTDLCMHYGINTGSVIAGGIGSIGRQEYTVMGDTVNLAGRLEEQSQPCEILVGPETYRHTHTVFNFERTGALRLQGKQAPVHAYRLIGRKAAREAATLSINTQMVGRQTELASLQNTLAVLHTGSGGLVTICAEAGTGKTRLVQELKNTGDIPASAIWLTGSSQSYNTNTAYHPWINLIHDLLYHCNSPQNCPAEKALQQLLETYCPDSYAEIHPYLKHLLGLQQTGNDAQLLSSQDGSSRKSAIFLAVQTVFHALTQKHPIVIEFEDMHWTDPTSIELLHTLLPLTGRLPIMVICLFRPDREHPCMQLSEGDELTQTHITLTPLSMAECREIVHTILSTNQVADEITDKIHARTEGNPLFIEETLHALRDNHIIAWNSSTKRYELQQDQTGTDLPETLQALLFARVDQLGYEAKHAIQAASVIGRLFQRSVLHRIMENPDDLDIRLQYLETADLIQVQSQQPDISYLFRHQLIQEAVYTGLLDKERARLHTFIAEVLEQLFPDRLQEYAELLAYHWSNSNTVQKAVPYLLQAGDKAVSQFANREALKHIQKAITLSQGTDTYIAALERRARIYLDTYDRQPAVADFTALVKHAEQTGDISKKAAYMIDLGEAYYRAALDEPEYAVQARETFAEACSLAEDVGDMRLLALGLLRRFWLKDFFPDYQETADAGLEQAWNISHMIQDPELIRLCMPLAAQQQSYPQKDIELAIKQMEERKDSATLKQIYFPMCFRYLYTGQPEKCIETAGKSIALAEQSESPPVMYPTITGLAYLDLGNFAEADLWIEREIADADHPFGQAFQLYGRLRYRYALGDNMEAARLAEKVISLARGVQRIWLWCMAQELLVLSRLYTGKLSDQLLDDVIAEHTRLQWSNYEHQNRSYMLAEIALARGELEQAQQFTQHGEGDDSELEDHNHNIGDTELQLRVLRAHADWRNLLRLSHKPVLFAEQHRCDNQRWKIHAHRAAAYGALQDDTAAESERSQAQTIIDSIAATIPNQPDRDIFINYARHW